MTAEYKESLRELNTILDYMGNEYIEKIPKKLVRFIKENMDTSYEDNINQSIPIDEQPLKNDTKILLSLIYRNYWCDEDKKKQLMEDDANKKREYEKEIYEKYNPDNIFKNRNKVIEDIKIKEDEKKLIVPKETFFKKIINKIKSFFKR